MEKSLEKGNGTLKLLLTIFIIISVVLGGFILYDKVLKKEDNFNDDGNNIQENDNSNGLSESEALRIAKEKLESANNFFGDFESSFECSDSIEDGFCYYDTIDNFKNKFYSIYSSKLVYSDVYNDITNEEQYKYLFGSTIKVSNNKVYVWNHCTEGTGGYSLKGNYEIISISDNTIKAKYLLNQDNSDVGEVHDEEFEMILVKENNSWKIMSATIVGRCTSIYKVGKK